MFYKMLLMLNLIAVHLLDSINANKICTVFQNGLLDTAFEHASVAGGSNSYILRGEHMVEIVNPNLRVILPRLRNITSLWAFDHTYENPIKDIEISFSVYSLFSPLVYFIRNSIYYEFENKDLTNIGAFIIEGVSVAFHPKVWYNNYHFIFINQTRQSDGFIKREYFVYDITTFSEPELVDEPELMPTYLNEIDDRYWIKAILEGNLDEGLIFIEYENVGYHCRFNNNSHTCDWNKIKNNYLFGCEALDKKNEQILIPSAIQDAMPEYNTDIQNILKYEKIVYYIVLGALLSIISIVFIALPIYVIYFPGKYPKK